MIYGKALKPGATVGLIGASGAIRSQGTLEKCVAETEKLGFRVKLGESCGQVYGYLSGTDEVRARDLNNMFLDDEVDGIICLKGGYGVMRMLDLIDYDAIRRHPKVFMGYSDITALHIALLQKCGLATLHGPMPASCWTGSDFDDFSRQSMLRALTETAPLGKIENPEGFPRTMVNPGVCEGMLVGGNLSLVVGLLGTPYELDTKGRILFLEDIGERTYRLDHMLTHLRLSGKFDDCAGIVLGGFTDCPIEYPEFGLSLEEIVRDVVAPCGKPVFTGLQAGHCSPKITLPLGVNCRMDAEKCELTALEAVVY